MIRFASAAIFVGLALAATSASAQTIYTDRDTFLAAITGASTTTFESTDTFIAVGPVFDGDGFTATTTTNFFIVDPSFDAVYVWESGDDVLDSEFGLVTFDVDAGATAFGFDFGNPDFFFGTGTVTINGVDYSLIGQPNFNFFGIVDDAALGSITVDFQGGLGIIDNVTTGVGGAVVPEPASWALMIAGFGLVGFAMRRRAIAHAA